MMEQKNRYHLYVVAGFIIVASIGIKLTSPEMAWQDVVGVVGLLVGLVGSTLAARKSNPTNYDVVPTDPAESL